jgi:hypothetical protein
MQIRACYEYESLATPLTQVYPFPLPHDKTPPRQTVDLAEQDPRPTMHIRACCQYELFASSLRHLPPHLPPTKPHPEQTPTITHITTTHMFISHAFRVSGGKSEHDSPTMRSSSFAPHECLTTRRHFRPHNVGQTSCERNPEPRGACIIHIPSGELVLCCWMYSG